MADAGESGAPRVTRPPVVFISYAHDSPVHADAVLGFYEFLRSECEIAAVIDVAAAQSPQEWTAWMIGGLREADFVLCVVSPEYRAAAEGQMPTDARRGVRWETRLLREEFYRDPEAARRRILPVILPGRSVDDIPVFMNPTSATHYVVSSLTRRGAEALLRYLTGQPGYQEPAISSPVPFDAASADLAELRRWRHIVEARTADAWTDGDRAPLRAAERDADRTLRDLHFSADAVLLHPARRRATDLRDGDEITIGSEWSAGDLFELLGQSVLVVATQGRARACSCGRSPGTCWPPLPPIRIAPCPSCWSYTGGGRSTGATATATIAGRRPRSRSLSAMN